MSVDQRIIENEGNPDYGTIYLIKQIHKPSKEILSQTGIKDLSPKQKRGIGLYQYRILYELFEKDITEIFTEASLNKPKDLKISLSSSR